MFQTRLYRVILYCLVYCKILVMTYLPLLNTIKSYTRGNTISDISSDLSDYIAYITIDYRCIIKIISFHLFSKIMKV